jgi:ubiquitin C-terminal hydrolase
VHLKTLVSAILAEMREVARFTHLVNLKASEQHKSVISELFEREIITHRKFKCGRLDPSDDQPSYLIMPLPSGKFPITIALCIRELTQLENFDEANPLWCCHCGCLKTFQVQVLVNQLAKYIVAQFLRFKHGQCGTTKDSQPADYLLKFNFNEPLNPARPTGK